MKYSLGKIPGDWGKITLEDSKRRTAVKNWSRFVLIAHITIAAASLWYGLWIIPVVVSLTPFYAKGLFWLLNNTQHVGLRDHVTDFRLNCRTIRVNPVSQFLYWHMNYHIEHHMYAGVPCYRLGALHRAIEKELPPTPKGLLATWTHIISVLERQREEPGYQYTAKIPGADDSANTEIPTAIKQPSTPQPATQSATQTTEKITVWECQICGFIYDQNKGLPEEGIAPGTPWDAIPNDWACPDCGVKKSDFSMVKRAVSVDRQHTTATAANDTSPLVILGAGLGGYTVAKEFRKLNSTRPIVMITADDGALYSKPRLSNALSENSSADSLIMKSATEAAQELNLTIHTHCTITRIDREQKRIVCDDHHFDYGDCIYALGASPIRPDFLDSSIHSINSLAHYRTFRDNLLAAQITKNASLLSALV